MSGTFPTSPGPSVETLDSNQPVIEDRSVSGKRQSRISAGHLWQIKMTWPKMTRAEFAPIFAFAAKQRGDSFQVSLRSLNTPQGSVSGSINVNGSEVAGNLTVNIDGFTPGATGVFKAGDVFKTGNHSKVYMVAADANAGVASDLLLEDGISFLLLEDGVSHLLLESSGQAAVQLTSPLIEALTDNLVITYTNVPFTMSFNKDIQRWKTTQPNLSDYEAELTESIS